MSEAWLEYHRRSEVFAVAAEQALRLGDQHSAAKSYAEAALLEAQAFAALDANRPRTLGIIGVSAAALYFKAGDFDKAERFALIAMAREGLPPFAKFQLREILQDTWIDRDKAKASVDFLPGQVVVSVSGGKVIYGGAPLDLIVDKVKGVQAMFYRTIEHVTKEPLRKSGQPAQHIQQACRPWLFQAPPGSYQFSVAVQKPEQSDFFREDIAPERIVAEFFSILNASAANDLEALKQIVPEDGYRSAFLKLTRGLAPTGKSFEVMDIRPAGSTDVVRLGVDTHAALGKRIKDEKAKGALPDDKPEEIVGVLRAVHLDKDWIEVAVGHDEKLVRITDVKDTLDDILGPMMNRGVVITALRRQKRLLLVDIELQE